MQPETVANGIHEGGIDLANRNQNIVGQQQAQSSEANISSTGWWFGTWLVFSIISGTSFPLTFIFFKMVKTTNQSISRKSIESLTMFD